MTGFGATLNTETTRIRESAVDSRNGLLNSETARVFLLSLSFFSSRHSPPLFLPFLFVYSLPPPIFFSSSFVGVEREDKNGKVERMMGIY